MLKNLWSFYPTHFSITFIKSVPFLTYTFIDHICNIGIGEAITGVRFGTFIPVAKARVVVKNWQWEIVGAL